MGVTRKDRGEWVVGDMTVLDDLVIHDAVTITGDVVLAGDFTIGEASAGSDLLIYGDGTGASVLFDTDENLCQFTEYDLQIGTQAAPRTRTSATNDHYTVGIFSHIEDDENITLTLRSLWARFAVDANVQIGSTGGWGEGVNAIEGNVKLYGGVTGTGTQVYCWQIAGVWAMLECDNTDHIYFETGSHAAGLFAHIELGQYTNVKSGGVAAAIVAFSNSHASATIGGDYVGVYVDMESGKKAFTHGIKVEDSVSTTGLDIGSCATAAITLTGTSTAGIDMSAGSITTDIKLSNSATLVNTSNTLTIEEATTAMQAGTLFGIESPDIRLGYDATDYMKVAVTTGTGDVAITHTGTNKAVTWTAAGGFDFVGSITLDAVTTSGKMAFGGVTDWGTGSTGVLIDGTGWDWASQTIARVNSDINDTAAAAAYHALSVTVSQGNSNSFFGTWTELYFSDSVDLTGADNNAAVWGQLEAGTNVTFFDTGCFTAGVYANVKAGATMVIGTGHSVNGVRAQLEVAAVTNNGTLAAFECLKKSGVDWEYGLYLADTATDIGLSNGGTIHNTSNALITIDEAAVALTGDFTAQGGGITAGKDSSAGTYTLYPGTTGTGITTITMTDNSGDTTTNLNVAGQTGARTYTIPDTLAATASFVMTEGIQEIDGAKNFVATLGVGKDASAGTLEIYPTTTNKGTTTITMADNDGDTITNIAVAGQTGSRTYTVPDVLAAASFVMTAGAQEIAGAKNFTSTVGIGKDASAGTLELYPTTTNQGTTTLTMTDNAGDTITNINVAEQAGARTYTVPDAGASADFLLTDIYKTWWSIALGVVGEDTDGAGTNGGGLAGGEPDLATHDFNSGATGAGDVLCKVFDLSMNGTTGTWDDLTTASNLDAWTNNYQLQPDDNQEAIGDAVAIGFDTQFCEVVFNDLDTGNGQLATYGATGGKWQYSDGAASWADLTVFDNTDASNQVGTQPFSQKGAITFAPPSGWVERTIDGEEAYWIQWVVTAVEITQAAIIDDSNKDEPIVAIPNSDTFDAPFKATIGRVRVTDMGATLHNTTIKFIVGNFTDGVFTEEFTWAASQRNDAFNPASPLAVDANDLVGVLITDDGGATNNPAFIIELEATYLN